MGKKLGVYGLVMVCFLLEEMEFYSEEKDYWVEFSVVFWVRLRVDYNLWNCLIDVKIVKDFFVFEYFNVGFFGMNYIVIEE